jgi:hypothetical protein
LKCLSYWKYQANIEHTKGERTLRMGEYRNKKTLVSKATGDKTTEDILVIENCELKEEVVRLSEQIYAKQNTINLQEDIIKEKSNLLQKAKINSKKPKKKQVKKTE